jgi:hypothetical protein
MTSTTDQQDPATPVQDVPDGDVQVPGGRETGLVDDHQGPMVDPVDPVGAPFR